MDISFIQPPQCLLIGLMNYVVIHSIKNVDLPLLGMASHLLVPKQFATVSDHEQQGYAITRLTS